MIRVMPTCTVDRKRSGDSARRSATPARRLVRAICLRRLLREATTDISDSAKNALPRERRRTSRISESIGGDIYQTGGASGRGGFGVGASLAFAAEAAPTG